MPMTIDTEHVAGSPQVAVISLVGELDASNFERLVDSVRQAYDDGARGLVLELTELSFMASSGLVALYSAVRIMRGEAPPDPEAGWGALHEMAEEHHPNAAPAVRLAGLQPPVDRVLERTGLKRLFDCQPTRADALESIQRA